MQRLSVSQMYGKHSSIAFKSLQELENISDETGLLYPYTDKLISMIKDDKYSWFPIVL